jgi:hypothetical protein
MYRYSYVAETRFFFFFFSFHLSKERANLTNRFRLAEHFFKTFPPIRDITLLCGHTTYKNTVKKDNLNIYFSAQQSQGQLDFFFEKRANWI